MFRIIFVIFSLISATSFAGTTIEDVSLIVSSEGNSEIVDCIVGESIEFLEDYELVKVTSTEILDAYYEEDATRYAAINFVAKHKETGSKQKFYSEIGSKDGEKGWHYLNGKTGPYLFTTRSWDFVSVGRLGAIEAPHYVVVTACKQ